MSILIGKNKVLGHTYQGGGKGGGGGGTQQSTGTTYTTNIPEYARPYVDTMLGATQKQLFTMNGEKAATYDAEGNEITPYQAGGNEITGFKPYQPYSTNVNDYVAGFSPLQQQAMQATGQLQLPNQIGMASNLAGTAGMQSLGASNRASALGSEALGYGATGQMYGGIGAQQALQRAQQTGRQANMYGGMGAGYGAQAAGLAPTAQAFGQEAADIGMGGLGYGALGTGYGAQAAQMSGMGFGAGQQFANQATDPRATQAYMSPYMQNVVDYQKSQALRDYNIGQGMRKSQAVGAGAFGGSRQAIVESEAERALGSQLQGIAATGSQKAFEDAQRQQQFGANLNLQGLGAGYQGLGMGMQGAQTGLQGLGTALQGQQGRMQGLSQAGQFFGQGMQGAQTGLQGVGAQQAAGNLGLAGTAQGMQGAGYGLQGVQGAVGAGQYGLQGLGQATQAASTLGQLGGQQLSSQKDIIGMQTQMGAQQQSLEQQKINQAIQDFANAQQYPLMQLGVMSNMLRGLPMQSQTTNQYVAAPNSVTQGIGLAGAGASIFNALGRKEGGVIKMAEGGITSIPRYDVGGEIESKLYEMQPDDLNRYIKESSSPSVKRMAQRILKEKSMAGGGIIAFNEGKIVKEDPEMVRQAYIDAAVGDRPRLDTSAPYVPKERNVPLTERIGRALGIKDAGREMPTRETTAMPVQAGGSDVPMVARSPELAAAEKAPVNPRSIVAAPPVAAKPAVDPNANLPAMPANVKVDDKGRADAAKQDEKPTAKPAVNPASIVAAAPPSTKPAGIQEPVDPDTNKTIAQLAADKAAYMGANAGAQDARKQLMAERANAADEARRTSALRMAEFFGAWGSTPGNTIVAGLNALKNKVPDIISDMKEETKIRRQIDKDISEIEKIERLEKAGNYEEASKRKSELAKNAVTTYGTKVKAASDAAQTAAYREVGLTKAAATGGGGGDDKVINNLLMRAKGVDDSLNTYKKANESLIKRANLPGDTPEIKKMRADAQAKLDADPQYKSLMARKAQVDGLLDQYQKVRAASESTSEGGKDTSTGKVIQYDAKGNRI